MLGRRGFVFGTAATVLSAARVLAILGRETMEERSIGVVELRQYTLYGGRRDALISLFERAFIEPQEALGAHVLGIFRDLDDPDRFVWLRGFPDMARRRAALEAFYSGAVWREHREAANATMVDSDNVLLLRPLRLDDPRADLAQPRRSQSRPYALRIHAMAGVDPAAFAGWFGSALQPRLQSLGAEIVATFVSETAANDFPGLPVRSDRVFAWLGRWPDTAAEAAFHDRVADLSGWRDDVPVALLPALMTKPERLRLAPTDQSPLR